MLLLVNCHSPERCRDLHPSRSSNDLPACDLMLPAGEQTFKQKLQVVSSQRDAALLRKLREKEKRIGTCRIFPWHLHQAWRFIKAAEL